MKKLSFSRKMSDSDGSDNISDNDELIEGRVFSQKKLKKITLKKLDTPEKKEKDKPSYYGPLELWGVDQEKIEKIEKDWGINRDKEMRDKKIASLVKKNEDFKNKVGVYVSEKKEDKDVNISPLESTGKAEIWGNTLKKIVDFSSQIVDPDFRLKVNKYIFEEYKTYLSFIRVELKK